MFDFSILISLLVSVSVFYLTIFFNLKKEIDDFVNTQPKDSDNNRLKISNRKRKLFFLNIITIILFLIIILLYFLPSIISIFNNIEPLNFSNIGTFFSKFLPFKEGFFSDTNFKFSFITGAILSLIIELAVFILYYVIIEPIDIIEYIPLIIILIVSTIGLIWINNYISIFLAYCIIHYFELLSIILNIIAYTLIAMIVFFVLLVCEEFLL